MLTAHEIRALARDYMNVEGYDDLRSILSIMSQEWPQEFDRREAMKIIREVLREALYKRDDVPGCIQGLPYWHSFPSAQASTSGRVSIPC